MFRILLTKPQLNLLEIRTEETIKFQRIYVIEKLAAIGHRQLEVIPSNLESRVCQ